MPKWVGISEKQSQAEYKKATDILILPLIQEATATPTTAVVA